MPYVSVTCTKMYTYIHIYHNRLYIYMDGWHSRRRRRYADLHLSLRSLLTSFDESVFIKCLWTATTAIYYANATSACKIHSPRIIVIHKRTHFPAIYFIIIFATQYCILFSILQKKLYIILHYYLQCTMS